MEFLYELGIFATKTSLIILAILIVLVAIFNLAARNRSRQRQELSVDKLNDHYNWLRDVLHSQILDKKEFKNIKKLEKKEKKAKKQEANRNRLFVLNFEGDIKATAVGSLREEITSILTLAKPGDEVVMKLESPGGMVSQYGLAASQLRRLRDAKIPLTVCVDTVAASGGYMMACVADKILAAPFAVVGSIGVVAGVPNFHRLLERNNVDYQEFTAGEFKRTVSTFGEVTPAGVEKFKSQIEEIHSLFKSFVSTNRPAIDIKKVSTGEYWYGSHAVELGLIDQITTSDDYLFSKAKEADLYEICYSHPEKMSDRLIKRLAEAGELALIRAFGFVRRSRYGI